MNERHATTNDDARLSRRSFLKLGGGGLLLAAGSGFGALQLSGRASALEPIRVGLAATDGWVSLPMAGNGTPGVTPQVPFFPDDFRPEEHLNLYSFGFRDVSMFNRAFNGSAGAREEAILGLRGLVQHTSPVLYRGLRDGTWTDFRVGERIEMELWNLGLSMRPDLADGHTIHWHGFPNAIPYFDGVPETSISVPAGRSFVYEFIPEVAGTYMYHCHFEDVEHVQMGMTGIVFVRPADYDASVPDHKTVFGSSPDPASQSRFDREYTWMITEIDLEEHWLSSHVQQPDWTEHRPDVFMINGRTFPDTLVPSFDNQTSVDRILRPENYAPTDRLRFQPVGSVVRGNGGETVLVRIANLGFRSHSLEIAGLPMRIVGIDAKPAFAGRDSYAETNLGGGYTANGGYESGPRADAGFVTNTLDVAPGASFDVLLDLPDNPSSEVLRFPFASRGVSGTGDPFGGGAMRSEVHVHPNGSLPAQTEPNF